MNGGTVVAQDLKEGTVRLRSAAEKGSVPAKVYLGNLYELGIHYKADPKKADVWYRNAGRAARVDAEPGGDDWNRALADLGCARHVLALMRQPHLDEQEKKRLLARAKAHGLGLRVRDDGVEGDRATFVDALAGAEVLPPTATPPPVAVELQLRERKDTSPETRQAKQKAEAKSLPPPPKPVDPVAKPSPRRLRRRGSGSEGPGSRTALGAFGYALLFAIAGASAGYAATLGARELVAHGHVLPLVGAKTGCCFRSCSSWSASSRRGSSTGSERCSRRS